MIDLVLIEGDPLSSEIPRTCRQMRATLPVEEDPPLRVRCHVARLATGRPELPRLPHQWTELVGIGVQDLPPPAPRQCEA
jgi:hypothetical protein